jgi:hypothetical protein
LNAPQPNAAARGPSRVARFPAEEPAAEESLGAHANRVLRSRLSAAATAVLDPGIALLQWLRKAAGGAQDAEAGEDGSRSRKDRPGGRPEAAAAPAAETGAPKPKRRLRALLVYLSVLLAGGMGGGALAYDLLEKLIMYHFSENRRLEASLSTQSKSAAAARQDLEQAQAGRIETEKKLAVLRAEYARAAPERQDKLAEAATRPGTTRAGNAQAPQPAGRDSADRQAPPPRTGDCSVIAGNDISALMDCIHKFNR